MPTVDAEEAPPPPVATLEFCGEEFELDPAHAFVIGREGDLVIDDNLYLHRRFLRIEYQGGLWWLANVGSQLTATVADGQGGVHAWLAPGARLPVLFLETSVRFTAGPTAYELRIAIDDPPFEETWHETLSDGETTIGPMPLTLDQRLLMVALAEPILLGDGRAAVPSNTEAAARLGWTATKFNRKLDNVCQKLARVGVRGLHGEAGALASNRRARLIEYALASRLVGLEDLPLLDREAADPG
ncbi:MAG: hypothetical protein JWM47_2101 [Acidimicrobiales bacterium]|nr:hypothetical protein [Acidimicrobiales bacterium]